MYYRENQRSQVMKTTAVTATYKVIAKTQLRRCPWGTKKGLLNRGLLVADINTGEQSWISNFRIDVIDPRPLQLIRWDGRNILCIVNDLNENDF